MRSGERICVLHPATEAFNGAILLEEQQRAERIGALEAAHVRRGAEDARRAARSYASAIQLSTAPVSLQGDATVSP